nr:ThiF family adenylyltransferase [Evansella clarkii]
MAYHYNIPIVYSFVGPGAWSGRAFRVVPGETGCYYCHLEHIGDDEELQSVEPNENQEIYDDGCATPAFIGSGIDTGIIANFTTRLSIQTLLSEEKDSYEQTENDHIFWISQGKGGNMKLVQKKIDKHPDCDHCNRS